MLSDFASVIYGNDDSKDIDLTFHQFNEAFNKIGFHLKIEENIKQIHQQTPEYKFNAQQIETYTTVGGTPHLDGSYTVFGEVIKGLEVIDKIAAAKTGKRDRPLNDIRMTIKVLKR